MAGKSTMEETGSSSDEVLRKGPWKLEEDEVLLNHVRRFGPRDWSSIRSKGLLHRTGKSCRLRWVNKLRPNLKNGCKFTAEEERLVIELQAQFGNKWAKIATYLPGRTDNNVKNFWSSRQKRLARLLQTSTASYKLQKRVTKEKPVDFDVSSMEAPKLSSASEGESSSRTMSCSSSCCIAAEPLNMFCSWPNIYGPKLHGFGKDFLQPEFNPFETIKSEPQANYPLTDFHTQPLGSTFSSQGLHDPRYLVDFLEPLDVTQLENEVQFPFGGQFFEPMECCPNPSLDAVREKVDNPESFFSEFPADIFDHIEPHPLPSSPEN